MRIVRGSERPVGGSIGQLKGLSGQLEDVRARGTGRPAGQDGVGME